MRGGGRYENANDVELLDVDPAGSTELDHVDTVSTNRLGAAVAVAAAIAAVVFVTGVGNNPSPPAEPPPVTIERTEVTRPQLTEHQQLEAEYRVALGEGPGLVWQRVLGDTSARYWRWNDGGFVSDNGATEWRIELSESGPLMTKSESVLVEYPGYLRQRLDGGQLLVPDVPIPDHFLLSTDEQEPVRFDLPLLSEPSPSGLTTRAEGVYGARIGDRVVVQRWGYSEVDIAAVATRIQRDLTGVVNLGVNNDQLDFYTRDSGPIPEPMSIAETGLTETEIEELRTAHQSVGDVLTVSLVTGDVEQVAFSDFEYTNDLLIGLDGELLFGWTDTIGRAWLSSTADGLTWSTESARARWLVNSGSQLFDLSEQGFSVSRTVDGGQTWDTTAVPLRETARSVAGDVVILGESWNNYETGGVRVETGTDQFTLYLFEDGQRFELRGPSPFGEPVTGWIYDPASGAAWDWATNSLAFSDVRTGDELLRISGHAVESAVAAQHPMEQMAMTRWPIGVEHPEWLLTSPVEVFGEGTLHAEFVSGEQYLLAIIITIDGYELFITDTEQA